MLKNKKLTPDPSAVRLYFKSKLLDDRWKGNQGLARCPFHNDRHASLSINAELGVFCCHACGARGGLIEFERRTSRCGPKTAEQRIAKLLNRGGGSTLRPRIVTIYSYRDENGKLRFQQVRFLPKDFRFRRPDGEGGWIWNLQGVSKILYHLQEVSKADEVFVAEGERDVETLRAWGLTATCNPGGAGKWTEEYSKVLAGKKVVIIPDADEPGQKHADSVARSVGPFAAEVKLLPPFTDAKDVTEWAEGGGNKEKLLRIAKNTKQFKLSVATNAETTSTPQAPTGDWRDECLRGELLVGMHEALYHDYLILPLSGLPLVLAVWGIGTYLFDVFDTYPYLCISSSTKRCGKTRLAEILERLCARAFMNVNISEAALFRKISKQKPTLIVDEAETLGNKHSERSQYILSIFQSGFRKGATVARCSGHGHELVEFDVYCPKVIIAIGNLPDTLRDRSVVIPMRRKLKSQSTQPYRSRKFAELAQGAARGAAVWAEKYRSEVERAYLKLNLDFLQDREADIWEPIFAIASVLAPSRFEELKKTALDLSHEKLQLDVDESTGTCLLADIRIVFDKSKLQRISTDGLLKRLMAIPESQWSELEAVRLSRILRPFDIGPRQLWIAEANVRGYLREDFAASFETYLPPQR